MAGTELQSPQSYYLFCVTLVGENGQPVTMQWEQPFGDFSRWVLGHMRVLMTLQLDETSLWGFTY